MAAFRIGVNALYLIPGGVGGTEIYLRSLLRAMAELDSGDEVVVFTNRETGGDLVPGAPGFSAAPQPVTAVKRPSRILYEQFRLPAAVRDRGCDVLFNPGFTSPRRSPCPSVSVFHDMQHRRHPEYFRWFDLPFWNLLLGQSVRTSEALLTVSEATARDLQHYHPEAAGKVSTVHHGVDERFFELTGERRPGPVLLCVSTLHPHKNIERLVRVFSRLRQGREDLRLVLAGMKGFRAETVQGLIEELGLQSAVTAPGWLPREDLYDLYRRAAVFVYPSLFEGFGMPVLEALAAGIPTACSEIPPLVEVAGPAASYFDPSDEAQMSEAIALLLDNEELRQQLSRSGPERARQFSWERCATETRTLLHHTANTG